MASELRVDKIVPTTGIPAGGGGGIIQVQSVTKTDTFTKASGGGSSFVDVTGLSVSITPKFNTSKILVLYDMGWGSNTGHCSCRLMRDSTPIKIGDASGNKTRVTGQMHHAGSNDQYDIEQVSGTFLDSPATTSAVTYKMQVGTPFSSSYAIFVNYHQEESDLAWVGRGASSITVMEISA